MAAKLTTPEQARQFHEAMTGSPLCFPDCCLCKATNRIKELELLIHEVHECIKKGDFEEAFDLTNI